MKAQGTDGHLVVGDTIAHFQGFMAGDRISIGFSAAFGKPYTVHTSSGEGSGRFILRCAMLGGSEAATMREMGIFADEDLLRNRTESDYFEDEIVGCRVIDHETRAELGTIAEIWQTPAHEIWMLLHNGVEVPVPAVPEFVKRVDVQVREVEILVLPGLLDMNRTSKHDERDDDGEHL